MLTVTTHKRSTGYLPGIAFLASSEESKKRKEGLHGDAVSGQLRNSRLLVWVGF